jgi:serine protease AprX
VARRDRRWARGAAVVVVAMATVAFATPACTSDRVSSATDLESVAVTTGATAYRNSGADGRGIDVALVDTGVARVPALAGRVVDGVDLTADAGTGAAGRDREGHGTHLAGIIAGVAPGARVVSVKVSRKDDADTATLVAGIDWVVLHRHDGGRNIRVLNLSVGNDDRSGGTENPLNAAVERAWRAGIVVVTAAGNDGVRAAGLGSPASDPYVLAVAASDSRGTANPGDDVVAGFSSRGNVWRTPDLVAPGTSVLSVRAPGSGIDREHPSGRMGTGGFLGSGTSQSAAVVSGAVALVLSRATELAPDQVKGLLTTTAAPMRGVDVRAQGAGLLDLRAAFATRPPSTPQRWDAAGAPTADGSSYRWSGNRWRGNRWRGNRWRGNRWSSASWGS